MTTGKKTISATVSTVLVIGATSSLAESICRILAQRGHNLILAGRDGGELELLASDLSARFSVNCSLLLTDFLAAEFSPAQIIEQAGEFDKLIIATGDMGSNDARDPINLAYVTYINYAAPAQLATAAAERLSAKGGGGIVIIGSVAGDRGRQSNYAYGAAKGALAIFASGLHNRLYPMGVHVMTVKPGFIDTPMTWGMDSPLIASREYAAEKIVRAMEKKKDVIYVPFFWRFIMLIIVHIPERIFKRLKL